MKHIKKKLITLAGIACFGMTVLFSPATTLTTEAATPSTMAVNSRAATIGYRFKEENGKLYRRLYNYSTGDWLGNWELVGNL